MRWLASITLLVACDSGAEKKPPAPAPPPPAPVAVVIDAASAGRSCDEVRPEHMAVEAAQREAYVKALADQGLKDLSLQSLEEIWQPLDEEPTGEWPPELSATSVSYKGQRRAAIATRVTDWAYLERDFVLAVDGKGNVYQVIKQLTPTEVKHITVDACAWGCFGRAPSGVERERKHGRYAYVLPKGHVFKGERRVDYRAVRIEYTTTRECEPPD